MNRSAFQRILHRYAAGQSPADERALVEQWYALLDDPDGCPAPQSAADWKRLETRLWHRIQARTHRTHRRRGLTDSISRLDRVWAMPTVRYGLAASIVVVLGLLVWQLNDRTLLAGSPISPQTSLEQTINRSEQAMRLSLSDGSVVILQPGSALQYPAQFGVDKREVNLIGAAFFEVVKNPKQPFLVYANELVTKVLGTSFWVRAVAGESTVQVVVRTGRVSVFRQPSGSTDRLKSPRIASGLILTPNQQLVFNRQETTFSKSLVAQPIALQPFDFTFRDAPVSEVLYAIGQTYGVTLVYDEDLLSRCPLTATLTQESLYGKLDLICKAIGADYQIIDGQIVINAKGCD